MADILYREEEMKDWLVALAIVLVSLIFVGLIIGYIFLAIWLITESIKWLGIVMLVLGGLGFIGFQTWQIKKDL